jgi:hypothetical protein
MASESNVELSGPLAMSKVGAAAAPGLARVRRLAGQLLAAEMSEDQRATIGQIEETVVSLQSLISDVLDLAALEDGSFRPAATTFDLPGTLREAIRLVRPRATERGLEISVTGLRSLPSLVTGDPGRLRQVVQHLVDNAIQATASGVVSLITQVVRRNEDSALVRFEVWDTGSGIPTDDLDRIFAPFETGTGFPGTGGMGLGLTVADRLVEAMGGSINVQSRPDTGSVFSFELEMEIPLPDEIPVKVKTGPAWVVLIADTVGPNDRLTPVLDRMGHAVTIHSNPELAGTSLALADSDLPDLLILAPSSRPIEMATRVLADPLLARIPVLLVAPDGQRGEGAACEAHHIDGYLAQPVSPVDLAEAISVLRGRRRRGGSLVTRHSLRERRGSLNILLVDASPTRRGTILRNLEPLGHRVEVAGNGALGLAAVTGGSYDAVVIDDEVGDLDSLALARAIRRWERGVPGRLRLVGMTQLGQALDERRYHAAGFDACVPRTAGIERLHAELVAD